MPYGRGRGGRGDSHPPYGKGAAGESGGGGGPCSGSVWRPSPSTPPPVPALNQAAPMGYGAPVVLPHQSGNGPPPVVYWPAGPASSQVSIRPPPPSVPVTIRAPPSSSPSAPAPHQKQATRAPELAAASSATSPEALAKEVEQKLFVSETALAPPPAAATGAASRWPAASDAEDASSDVDLASVSKKGLAHPAQPGLGDVGKKVMIRANHFLVDVADDLFHCDMILKKYTEDTFAQEFGINVSSDLMKCHDFGRKKTFVPSVGLKKLINEGTIDNWTCLIFSHMRLEELQRFYINLMRLIHMCNATGMNINAHRFVEVKTAAPTHIENSLREVHTGVTSTQMLAQQGRGDQLQLLIVIPPDVRGSYVKIKTRETDIGIVPQCCLPRHASRPNKQHLENTAIKITLKVGGCNTILERAFVCDGILYVSEVPTIIFGADVTPPEPGGDSASIAVVVASMDWPEITEYRGLVSAQAHRQETIEDVFTVSKDPQKGCNVNGGMIRELLNAFRRKTNRRPERIIFYRDGVSKGSEVQFSHVLHEMDAIRKACLSLEGYVPPVTFMVVQKMHHTRLFPEVHGRGDMTDKRGNILPGTVDQKICHPTDSDFYLCSHAGIQGTSRPTYYYVLYDENHFTADALHSLTSNFCYIHAQHLQEVPVAFAVFYDCCMDIEERIRKRGSAKIGEGSPLHTGSGSTRGNSGLAAAIREGHEADDCLTKDNSSQMVPVKIKFYGECYRVEVKKGVTLEAAVGATLDKHGLSPDECFFLSDGGMKGLKKDSPVVGQLTVDVHVSLKGGVQICGEISVYEWMESLDYPNNWFEKIYVPLSVRWKHSKEHYVVALSPNGAQLVLIKILDWLERLHKEAKSFSGSISLDDLIYIPSLGTVIINPTCVIDWKPLTQCRYEQDCSIVVEFIEKYLQYEDSDSGRSKYAMHVGRLKRIIEKLDEGGSNYMSEKERSLIFNSPATMSLPRQIGIFTNLMINYHRGGCSDEKKKFEKLLGYVSSVSVIVGNPLTDWKSDVTDQNSPAECEEYTTQDLLDKVSNIEILAGLYMMWNNQLAELQHILVVVFDDWVPPPPSPSLQPPPPLAPPPPPPPLAPPRKPRLGYSGLIISDTVTKRTNIRQSEFWDR